MDPTTLLIKQYGRLEIKMRCVSGTCGWPAHYDLGLCNSHLLLIQLRHAYAVIILRPISQRNTNAAFTWNQADGRLQTVDGRRPRHLMNGIGKNKHTH